MWLDGAAGHAARRAGRPGRGSRAARRSPPRRRPAAPRRRRRRAGSAAGASRARRRRRRRARAGRAGGSAAAASDEAGQRSRARSTSSSCPAARGQAAGDEEDRRGHAVGVGGEQRRWSPAVNSGADRDPGEDQPGRRCRALRPDQAKAKTSAAASRPKTSAPTGSSAIEPGKSEDDQDRAEAGAAGDADHVGRGERVGQRPLQQRARRRRARRRPTSASTVRGSRSVSTICSSGAAAAAAESDVDAPSAQRHVDRAERQRGDDRGGERRRAAPRRPAVRRRHRVSGSSGNCGGPCGSCARRRCPPAAASCRPRRRCGRCAPPFVAGPGRVVAQVLGRARGCRPALACGTAMITSGSSRDHDSRRRSARSRRARLDARRSAAGRRPA